MNWEYSLRTAPASVKADEILNELKNSKVNKYLRASDDVKKILVDYIPVDEYHHKPAYCLVPDTGELRVSCFADAELTDLLCADSRSVIFSADNITAIVHFRPDTK